MVVVLILVAAAAAVWSIAQQSTGSRADPGDAKQVALGKTIYDQHCASCHGARLEGQPRWQSRLPNGRMPAPPHDATGHTWHHPDEMLFGMTKEGIVPGKYAPPGYQSDMPAFGATLSDDEIWAVLAYIESRWPREIQQAQRERRHAMR
ncbi:MAG: cytochrome c [Burkholderiales bacterium]|nr:cytochrome c [Burkholderiales bacterium]